MADLEDKKVSQLESGTVTSNSVFLDSGNGVSTKVGSQDVANFVGKTHAFSGSGGLNTTAKTLVGAINEVAGSAGKSNLADMDDVNIDDQTLAGGQGLVYDDTNDEWVNGEVASALESLTDVDIDSTSLADGQAIVYDETNDKWVNGTVSGGASVIQKTMAEYTALPSSEKMNGSIYKITDKALIYCLDEEYHALKEITSADYALLTSAEKNNGTLYVITDEETTAADIEYTSGVSVADKLDNVPTFDTLTTSDNNKLLGVSVSGSDISVGAVGSISLDMVSGAKNLIKATAFNIKISDITRNMDLTSYVNNTLDSGYKFLAYIAILPQGFTTDQFLWLANPHLPQGNPWWNTNPISGGTSNNNLRFMFLEIKNI